MGHPCLERPPEPPGPHDADFGARREAARLERQRLPRLKNGLPRAPPLAARAPLEIVEHEGVVRRRLFDTEGDTGQQLGRRQLRELPVPPPVTARPRTHRSPSPTG